MDYIKPILSGNEMKVILCVFAIKIGLSEVPVFLTPEDTCKILKAEGGLLGHIDLLQIFNGRIRILDYKPEASKKKHVMDQLLL